MKSKRTSLPKGVVILVAGLLLVALAACAPAATPAPTQQPTAAKPTTAPSAPPTAAPTAQATAKPEAPATAKPTAPSAAKPSGAPVKIGFITPLSGAMGSYGATQSIAAGLAEQDTNNSGGINGSPLQLVIKDSPFDPKQAVTQVRELAEKDKVFAIVGPYSSGEFEVAAPLANELKLAVVSASGLKPGIAPANRPWSFLTNVGPDSQNSVTIQGFKKTYPNVKRVVLTGDTKEAITQSLIREILPKYLKDNGLEIIDTVPFETTMTDYSPIVTKIKDLKPDGIALCSLLPQSLNMAKELKQQGVRVPVVTCGTEVGGPFVEGAGDAAEGWVLAAQFDEDAPDPAVKSFVTRYYEAANADSKVTPKPKHVSTEGGYYDTVMIVADIMRKGKVTPDMPLEQARTVIRDGLQGLKNYKGVVGTINMTATGNVDRPGLAPYLVKGGQWSHLR